MRNLEFCQSVAALNILSRFVWRRFVKPNFLLLGKGCNETNLKKKYFVSLFVFQGKLLACNSNGRRPFSVILAAVISAMVYI
jgi:hypothetical protein